MAGRRETLGSVFQEIARLRVFCFNSILKESELTATQAWVLSTLLDEEGVIQGDLAQKLGIRAVTLGGLVDRLEGKGWIERRPDEKDRRAKRIWLTPAGRKLEKRINRSLEEVHKIAIGGLPEDRVAQMEVTIGEVRENLRAYKRRLEDRQ
jgi:DNA-binding MarR family transcriptional regulator